jgi:hypothetical protein
MKFKLSTPVKVVTGLIILAAIAGTAALVVTRDTGSASAAGGPNVEVSFTKWVNDFPNMDGTVACEAGAGTFDGLVLNSPDLSAPVTKVVASYGFVCDQAEYSFTALLDVRQNNGAGTAVLNGMVTDGQHAGAQVHGNYQLIACDEATSGTCFQGTLHIMAGSASE